MAATVAVAVLAGVAWPLPNAAAEPVAVARLELDRLAGDWFEVASTGSWWHRRCVADTRYRFRQPDARGVRVASACTTAGGPSFQRGRLRAGRNGDGRLAIRFGPPLLGWLPATWSDFWVLATDAQMTWMLVGDNRGERLALVARTIVVDEAVFAQASVHARRHGYDAGRLTAVSHPAGAGGLVPRE